MPARSRSLLVAIGTLTGCCLLASCSATGDHRPQPIAGIPRVLLEQARPIGKGARFHPAPAANQHPNDCRQDLGARASVHIEVFAANRVVIVPAGIGVGAPWSTVGGRITRARCYGALVTLEPTGVALIARGLRLRVADLFRAWGQRLSSRRLASFSARAGTRVRVYVDGRRVYGAPGAVPLSPHAEIVLEVGPYIPPHHSFAFPPVP
jgi:hypothetical protein